MAPGLTAEDFRDGVMLELEEELTDRCIEYLPSDGRDQMPIGIEITDRARFLLGMWAVAAEITKRQEADR